MKYREKKSICKCGEPMRPGQRWCKACHAAYMREWRAKRVFVLRKGAMR